MFASPLESDYLAKKVLKKSTCYYRLPTLMNVGEGAMTICKHMDSYFLVLEGDSIHT